LQFMPVESGAIGDPPEATIRDMTSTHTVRVDRPLVLIGMMGAGKSTIGRRLAARLGLPFNDADSEIEKAADCTIEEIFQRYGEPHFRDGERRVIARLLGDGPQVLSAGGGAFIDPETRALVQREAVSIWLRADLEVLWSRVSRRSDRPLLKTADPKGTLTRLMEERYPIYAEADIVADCNDAPKDETTERLLDLVKDFLARNGGPRPAEQGS